MVEPYIGEIRLFAGSVAPEDWALCNGQSLTITQYAALYALLGATYGGNATTFNLPDFRGRVPVHVRQGTEETQYALGATGGAETVELGYDNLPSHLHTWEIPVSGLDGNVTDPTEAYLANSGAYQYSQQPGEGTAALYNTQPAGLARPHPNMQPSLCVNFIIALRGIFPGNA